MIPLVRTIAELMVITDDRNKHNKKLVNYNFKSLDKIIHQDTENNKISDKKKVILPDIPKNTRRKWIKSREAVSKFFDNLDYNNQIQSSYDITLLESQKNYDHQDIA